MINQVIANILFTDEDEARDFYHDCELALAKAGIINSDELNIEFSSIELVENNHDQDPNQPCQVVSHADNFPEH